MKFKGVRATDAKPMCDAHQTEMMLLNLVYFCPKCFEERWEEQQHAMKWKGEDDKRWKSIMI